MPHFDFMRAEVACSQCSWTGAGRDCVIGGVFEGGELTEYGCPICGERIAAVPWPTVDVYRANWDSLSEAERTYVHVLERRAADRESLRRFYKPLPPDHPLRNKVFFVPVNKREPSKPSTPSDLQNLPVDPALHPMEDTLKKASRPCTVKEHQKHATRTALAIVKALNITDDDDPNNVPP